MTLGSIAQYELKYQEEINMSMEQELAQHQNHGNIANKNTRVIRVALKDVRDAIKQLSCVGTHISQWFVRGDKLHLRKCAQEFCCEVVVPIVSASGQVEDVRFDVYDDALIRLDSWHDELHITIVGIDELPQVQFSCPAAAADTETYKAEVLGRPLRISPSWRYQIDGPRKGVAVPAQLILEAIRTTRGFLPEAFANYQAIQFSHDGTTGLAFAGDAVTNSRFTSMGLGEVTWNIPREMVQRVNTFIGDATVVQVYADEVYTAVARKDGTFLQWSTLKCSALSFACPASVQDQSIVRVSASAIKEAVRYLGGRSHLQEQVVLRISPRCAELVVECPGTGSGTFMIPTRSEPESLGVDSRASFSLGAIRQAMCGLKGKTLELSLSQHSNVDKGSQSWALSTTEEYIVRPRFGRGCTGLPAECRVTRVVTNKSACQLASSVAA
jgi:hypothetical protein